MKKIIRAVLIVVIAIFMCVSSLIIVSAEDTVPQEESTKITVAFENEDGGREYELVWKFKFNDTHLWKRRWNATLGMWYDPEWILVY